MNPNTIRLIAYIGAVISSVLGLLFSIMGTYSGFYACLGMTGILILLAEVLEINDEL